MWLVIQLWSFELLQPFKRRRNKSLWVCIENACSEITQKQPLISYHASMLGSLRELDLSFMGQLRMLLVTRTQSMVPMESSQIPVAPPLLAKCQLQKNAKKLRKQRQPGMGATRRALSSLLWAVWVLPLWCEFERLHSNQMPLSKQRAAIKPWQPHQAFCRDDPVSMLGVSSSTDPTCRKSPPRS